MTDPLSPLSSASDADKAKAEELTAEWVLIRLMAMADNDVTAIIELDAWGFPSVNIDLLTPEMKMAMQELTVVSNKGNKKITAKFADKLKALDMLGRYMAMFKDKVSIDAEVTLVERLQAGRARMNEQSTTPEVAQALVNSDGAVRLKGRKEP